MLWVGIVSAAPSGPSEDDWSSVLKEAVPAVVALRVTGTRYFDTEKARSSQGTGFVVDRERGIILTNRHMVHAGPVLAEAVFLNHEEVELKALYRDPVHDFGFYQFDPEKKQVRYMDVVSLALKPDAAKVGDSIRVIGNDSGEKLSILDGTLARLTEMRPIMVGTRTTTSTRSTSRQPQRLGGHRGRRSSTGMGMLWRLMPVGSEALRQAFTCRSTAQRALRLLQAGESVTRGTLQATYVHRPFDELERLGLRAETQRAVREEDGDRTGMLVVERVGPRGPGDGKIQPGDILKTINGETIRDFVGFEAILDESVGAEVTLQIERGGQDKTVNLVVQDLHAITPAAYLEVGRAVFNELSYQLARNYHIPVGGPYLATSGYMMLNGGVPPGTVITHVDGVETPTLTAFRDALASKADGQRVRFRFFSIKDFRHSYGGGRRYGPALVFISLL